VKPLVALKLWRRVAMPELFFLLRGVFLFFFWLDDRSRRPLRQLVPELDELLSRPADVLSYRDIHIGPWRRIGSFVGLALLGLLVSVFLGMWFTFCLLAPLLRAAPDLFWQGILGFGGAIFIVILWLSLRALRGGHCTLRLEGVYLRYRRTEVFCPWALFNAPGEPFIHKKNLYQIEMPIDMAAVPRVQARMKEAFVAEGWLVKTVQFRFRGIRAVLRPLYQISPQELAWLLLHLGAELGERIEERSASDIH
jgi:hypothetical protein